MIKGVELALRVGQLLESGISVEETIYQVTKEKIECLPEYLRDDPQEISTILNAVMFYATNYSGELLGYKMHDIVLKRLLPKAKTARYIQTLFEEV